MQSLSLAVIVLVPVFLVAPSCRTADPETPRRPAASAQDSPSEPKTQSTELQRRDAARLIRRLEALLPGDRQAVATGELRLENVRSLFDAGRVTSLELQAAEQELVELRQTLLRHEQELAAARRATAGS